MTRGIDINTQNVERFWRDLKEWIKLPGNKLLYFKQYISGYFFIGKYPETALIHRFFTEAAKLYPPQSDSVRTPIAVDDNVNNNDTVLMTPGLLHPVLLIKKVSHYTSPTGRGALGVGAAR